MSLSLRLGVAIVGCGLAFASAAAAVNLWTGFGAVTSVYAGKPDKSVLIFGPSNAQGCANPGINFTTTDSDVEAIRSLALTSMLSGKKLRCLTLGCVNIDGTNIVQRGQLCELAP